MVSLPILYLSPHHAIFIHPNEIPLLYNADNLMDPYECSQLGFHCHQTPRKKDPLIG